MSTCNLYKLLCAITYICFCWITSLKYSVWFTLTAPLLRPGIFPAFSAASHVTMAAPLDGAGRQLFHKTDVIWDAQISTISVFGLT